WTGLQPLLGVPSLVDVRLEATATPIERERPPRGSSSLYFLYPRNRGDAARPGTGPWTACPVPLAGPGACPPAHSASAAPSPSRRPSSGGASRVPRGRAASTSTPATRRSGSASTW